MPKKLTQEDFIKKSKLKHGEKYDYSQTVYSGIYKKAKIICPIHGLFEQAAESHTKGSGCPKCGCIKQSAQTRGDTESFILKAVEKHGNRYDYSLVEYRHSKSLVKIICEKHGVFEQGADSHLKGSGCQMCYRESVTLDTQEFVTKAKEKHGDKYDYSISSYKTARDKIEIKCKIHGVFSMEASDHLSGAGCQKCSGVFRGDTAYFTERAAKKHSNKYDYSLSEYKNATEKIKIICPQHGVFEQIPSNHLQGSGCPSCACCGSSREDDISDFIQSLGIKTENNLRKIVGDGREIDIFIPEKKLAIEYNGLYWHTENRGEKDKKYHLSKTTLLAEKGIRLIHIFEDEMIHKKEIVLSRLKSILVDLPKIHARKCEIREITPKVKNEFLEKTHIQGGDRAATSLGAFHGEDLVAVMTFCKARVALGRKGAKNEGVMELSRFSAIPDYRVVGIAGKLLKFYERKYTPREIISYADRRWSEGGLYKALGFKKIHDSAPNYWYFKSNGSKTNKYWMRRIHRFNFARHRLEKFFNETFPKEMTEWEIMKLKGWDRIWDCGNILFSKIVTPSDN